MNLSLQTVNHSPHFGANLPLRALVCAAAEAGFEQVGLDLWSIEDYLAEGRCEADVARLIAEAGLTCSDLLPLVIGPDPAAVVDRARRFRRLADFTGARLCLAACSEDCDLGSAAIRAALDESAALLSSAGVRIAFEFVPYSPMRTMTQAIELCDSIGWERSGLAIDSWHTMVGDQIRTLAAVPPGGVALVQFADGMLPLGHDPVTASRHHRLLPGRGNFDLGAFVDAVQSSGYEGVISAEILSADARSTDPTDFALEIRRRMDAYWAPLPSPALR